MSERKVDTVDIGKGIQYARVADRLAAFHADNASCSITTTCQIIDDMVVFSATVTCSRGTFSGHSMDRVRGRVKQFEKQESIAVGRALAFAGYLASGDIATYEEMQDLVTSEQLTALKLRWSKEFAEEIDGLDREEKARRFNSWCKQSIGEDIDYSTPTAWDRAWLGRCWTELTGVSPDVPY